MQASIFGACPMQARVKWEGCGRKGIRRKNGGMMEVGRWLVRVEWRPAGWSISLSLLSSLAPLNSRRTRPCSPRKRPCHGCVYKVWFVTEPLRTNGQSNLKTDRIAAAYGRCNVHWYWPGGASIHLYLIMLPWAHSSPDPKRHLDRFSHFCTAHRRVCLYLYFIMAAPPSQNRPFSWGIWTSSNTWFSGPTQVLNPNGISIGSAVCAGLTTVTDKQTDRQTTLLGL